MNEQERTCGDSSVTRRTFVRGAVASGGALSLSALLAACGVSSAPAGGGSTAASSASSAGGAGGSGPKVIDQFYTLNNAYFQGWSRGSAQAAAALGLDRVQEVDNENDEKVISIYQAARSQHVQGISSMLSDPGISPRIVKMAAANNIHTVLGWNIAPWFSTFSAAPWFYAFITPDNITGARTLAELLFKKMGGSGEFIHITGIPGNSVDITRTVGVNQALKKYPGIKLVARQPGQFDRGQTTPVISSLLTAHPGVKGIFAQNDDSAVGVINALRSQNMEVPVTGIDAIPDFLGLMQSDPKTAFATWAHHGAWMGGVLMVKLYDVLHHVKLTPAEQNMFSGGFIIDTPQAGVAYKKIMYSGGKFPFDYRRMSKALHPDDWDMQNAMAPVDLDHYFGVQKPKPSGYTEPPSYAKAVKAGELQKVAKMYASHYKTDPFASVRKLCHAGGKEFE